jgi:hypothetical protein
VKCANLGTDKIENSWRAAEMMDIDGRHISLASPLGARRHRKVGGRKVHNSGCRHIYPSPVVQDDH